MLNLKCDSILPHHNIFIYDLKSQIPIKHACNSGNKYKGPLLIKFKMKTKNAFHFRFHLIIHINL